LKVLEIKLDLEVHPDHITPQDFDGIIENRKVRPVKIGVAIKSSKWKSCCYRRTNATSSS
jgi:hypothetical protein